jgi:hypothetical protein
MPYLQVDIPEDTELKERILWLLSNIPGITVRELPEIVETNISDIAAHQLPEIEDADEALFEKLRQWRLEKAREENVSAYIIFRDRTLSEVANKRCRNKECLIQIWGIGESKVEMYGEDLIGIIENFEGKVEDNNQTTILGLNDEQLALVADHLTMSIMQDIVDPRQLLDDDVINNDLIDLVGALPVVDDDEVYGVGEVGKLIKYFNLFLDYHELIEDIDTGIQTLQQRTRFISELLFIHNEFPENFRIRGPIQTKIRALNEMGDLPDEANLRANAELNHNIALLQEREQLECNLCQSLMVIREGANGYFWGCSTFPNCWSTRHLTRDEKDFLGIT